MMKNYIIYFLGLISLFFSCSDFDEQEFTVLLPNAGEDKVIFSADTGTTIQLDGSASSDVNQLGFEYQWIIISEPDGFPVIISNATSKNPTFEISNDTSGRYELALEISNGDQIARDFVNIDINPAFAEILFVNAIDSEETAIFKVPDVNIIGSNVASKNAEESYKSIDTNVTTQSDGTTLLEVDFNNTTITLNPILEALKSYTLYLVGTKDNPELLFVEKIKNQNTIPIGLVAIDAINLVPETNDVTLFIDAPTFGFPITPFDTVLKALGIPEQFGSLNYQDNGEIFFPSNSIFPLPIWATTNGERISNDTQINLPSGVDASFGTFILFPDANTQYGHTIKFINNSDLLPL